MADFETVFEGDHLRAAWHPGTKPLLIVTFDYRRLGRDGFSAINHSSGFARQGYGQLSISTRRNDWFINPETEALETALAPIAARYGRVQALGYSMGGYGALRFARALSLKGVVAISPQATIAPGAVPGDRRYAAEARGFDPDKGDLVRHALPGLTGVILLDPFIALDRAHAALIRRAYPRLRLVPLAFGGHPASRVLRDGGKTWLLQREAAAETQTGTAILVAHRAARRSSQGYWERLARAAAPRRPALATLALERAAALAPLRPLPRPDARR